MPACSDSSFSGTRPTDRSKVSQSKYRSVPGSAFPPRQWRRFPAPAAVLPVDPGYGAGKIEWNLIIFQALHDISHQPAGIGHFSKTANTSAPSSVSRRAMIRPMSTEPSTTMRRPIMIFFKLTRFWAAPAVKYRRGGRREVGWPPCPLPAAHRQDQRLGGDGSQSSAACEGHLFAADGQHHGAGANFHPQSKSFLPIAGGIFRPRQQCTEAQKAEAVMNALV